MAGRASGLHKSLKKPRGSFEDLGEPLPKLGENRPVKRKRKVVVVVATVAQDVQQSCLSFGHKHGLQRTSDKNLIN